MKPLPRDALQRFWSLPEMKKTLAEEKRVAVGVSGGVDSMALLALLTDKGRPDWAPEISAFHIHHGLRPEADEEERLVATFSRERGVDFQSRRLHWEGEKAPSEENLREARYAAFEAMLSQAGIGLLCLGHHRDDLAETLLMRLLRGSGVQGLAGFGFESRRGKYRLFRPLLDWSREELQALAEKGRIPWAEDGSNADVRFFRNRVRREILPVLEAQTVYGSASAALARAARNLEQEAAALEQVAAVFFQRRLMRRDKPKRIGLDLRKLGAEERAVLPGMLRKMWMEVRESPLPPEAERIREILAFLEEKGRDRLLQSAGNVVVWKEGAEFLWMLRKPRREVEKSVLLDWFHRES